MHLLNIKYIEQEGGSSLHALHANLKGGNFKTDENVYANI